MHHFSDATSFHVSGSETGKREFLIYIIRLPPPTGPGRPLFAIHQPVEKQLVQRLARRCFPRGEVQGFQVLLPHFPIELLLQGDHLIRSENALAAVLQISADIGETRIGNGSAGIKNK